MKSNLFDVIIVGSGPAGARAAYSLAKAGCKTALLEKAALPRYKVCGGGITQRGLSFLPDGMPSFIENEFKAISLNFLDLKRQFSQQADPPLVTMVMRDRFDNALVQLAQKVGANIFPKTTVLNIMPKPSKVEIYTNKGTFVSEYLILADGAKSQLAEKLSWPDGRVLVPAVESEIYLSESDWSRHQNSARFDFGFCKRGYSWIFPKSKHLSVGMLSWNGKRLKKDFINYLKFNGLLLNQKKPQIKGHFIPMSPRKGPFMDRRILLIGDTAGFVDPVTGEGISFALKSGVLAAESLILGQFINDRVTKLFEEKIRKEILREIKIGSWLSCFIYGPKFFRTFIFKNFGTSLCKAMCKVIQGEKTYFELLTQLKYYSHLLFNKGNRISIPAVFKSS